ncbi:MAG: glycosyltransferase family 2 protein [Gammaproteobacteria bacterium]|nr:glycosyltransferase family 2 protein [Gammaproteobacteria bacterium]
MPAYGRPELVARTLRSVLEEPVRGVEIVVSDNSEDDASERVCRAMLDLGSGRHRYVRNRPNVGLVGNHNRCIELAAGEWMLILHDDDYLLTGAVRTIADAAEKADDDCMAMLFGVKVVDADGRLLKRQFFGSERRLQPDEALRHLMRNSSFVRPPAIVVRRAAYGRLGGFAEEMQGTIDIDMWSRLFPAFGVCCMPQVTAAYTVHPAALTTGVFEAGTIARLNSIFDRLAREDILSESDALRCRREFLHQFILGGAYRRIRERDLQGAARIMRLFALPHVRSLGVSFRWWPVRAAFSLLTAGSRGASAANGAASIAREPRRAIPPRGRRG